MGVFGWFFVILKIFSFGCLELFRGFFSCFMVWADLGIDLDGIQWLSSMSICGT